MKRRSQPHPLTTKLFLVASILLGGVCLASAQPVALTNATLAIRMDPKTKGIITAIVDRASGRNFVAGTGQPCPLYTLTLADEKYSLRRVVSSEATGVMAEPGGDGRSVGLTFTHESPKLRVRVRVRLPAEGGLSYWRLEVENSSALAVVSADFPGFALPQVLGARPDETCVIFPRANNSQRFWNLPEEFRYLRQALSARAAKRGGPKKTRTAWPLVLAEDQAPDVVQMMACYDLQAGLYLATHDSNAQVKKLSVEGLDASAMRLKIEHLRPIEPGKDFTMNYETVVGVFHGDWTAAADLYRDWATQQRWCAAGTLANGKDTPTWLTRHPIYLRLVLEHPLVSDRGRTRWQDVPKVLEQFKREHPDLYDNAIVHFVDFDRGGYWQGYYNERWPAWIGDDVFAAEIRRLKSLGLHPCIEPFGWLMANDGTPHGRPGYRLAEQPFYPELKQHTLVWSRKDVVSDSEHPDRSFACLASPYGRGVFVDDVRKTAPWGLDLFQFMEVKLVDKMNCYSAAHGHPLGAGAWVYDGAYKIFEQARNTGRKLNPDFCTDKEETAESLIPVLDSVYVRNAQFKNMRWNGRPQFYKNNIPLFDYLYHEYVTMLDGIQANDPLTMRWCAGIAAVLGHVTGPLFGGDPNGRHYQLAQVGGAWEIIRQAHAACNSYARQHLVFGRVLPPPDVGFPEMKQPKQAMSLFQQLSTPGGTETTRAGFVTPKVLQSAHRAPDGSVGLCFVNVSDDTVRFKLTLSPYAKYLKQPVAHITVRHNGEVRLEKTAEVASATPLQIRIQPLALVFVTVE